MINKFMHTDINTYIHTCMRVSLSVFVYMFVYVLESVCLPVRVRSYVPLNRGECVHTCIAVCVCVCVCVVISGFTFSSSSLTFLYHNPSVCLPPFQPIHHSLAHQLLSLSLSQSVFLSVILHLSISVSLGLALSPPACVFVSVPSLFHFSPVWA